MSRRDTCSRIGPERNSAFDGDNYRDDREVSRLITDFRPHPWTAFVGGRFRDASPRFAIVLRLSGIAEIERNRAILVIFARFVRENKDASWYPWNNRRHKKQRNCISIAGRDTFFAWRRGYSARITGIPPTRYLLCTFSQPHT